VALRSKIINFIRLHLLDDSNQIARIRHIAIMQDKTATFLVWVSIQMVYAVCIEQRGSALDAMDLIAFIEQQLRKIGAILTSNTSDKSFFHFRQYPLSIVSVSSAADPAS